MSGLDWAVLAVAIGAIVGYGAWRSRGVRTTESYLRAGADLRWWTIGLSLVATQASAITFLSVPGQAYVDGVGFVQFYFGLPLAMVILSAVIVPVYHRLGVYTAYEYLERRFDRKTRQLAALLFLVSRGLASGLAIYAPALVLSAVLGWSASVTNLALGGVTVVYTVLGGSRAVSRTQSVQMAVVLAGMLAALAVAIASLPVSLGQGIALAGALGKLKGVDLSLRFDTRYTLWSGLLGGLFVQLAYFGTDQSQVQRYLAGGPLAQSRLGLLMNGLVKVPMQFFILFIGVMVFVYYQLAPPPLFFDRTALEQARDRDRPGVERLERAHSRVFAEKRAAIERLLAPGAGPAEVEAARARVREEEARDVALRREAGSLVARTVPSADAKDSDFIFLRFVLDHFPRGLLGLLVAAILSAAMSANSAALSSLGATTVVDFYKPRHPEATDAQTLRVARLATAAWGIVAVGFGGFASLLDNLIQAVNVLGSLFYGPMLGVFLLGFFVKRVRGSAAFAATAAAEAAVLTAAALGRVGYLWYNVIGCAAVLVLAPALEQVLRRMPGRARSA
ncbi:MAG TPA: sodium:solute symporter [Anaeromyxobacteraceae bacterium]|nr:sodium:solute symporter [Anaeromyxobacteraceae bacterium]